MRSVLVYLMEEGFNKIVSMLHLVIIIQLLINKKFQQQSFVCQIKSSDMQITQTRSTSKKSNRCTRDSPEPRQKTNSYLIASKIGDLSHRNQTTCSKELDNKKGKNPTDNAEYIRNLYKKYLGKQNNNVEKKNKTDIKDIKVQRALQVDACRQKLTYQEQNQIQKTHYQLEGRFSHELTSMKKYNAVDIGMQNIIQKCNKNLEVNYGQIEERVNNFYDKILDNNQMLRIIGNDRSSLVLGMMTINGIRKKHR